MIKPNLDGLIHTTEHQIIRLVRMTDTGINYGKYSWESGIGTAQLV
jgi:hypothetical protein